MGLWYCKLANFQYILSVKKKKKKLLDSNKIIMIKATNLPLQISSSSHLWSRRQSLVFYLLQYSILQMNQIYNGDEEPTGQSNKLGSENQKWVLNWQHMNIIGANQGHDT